MNQPSPIRSFLSNLRRPGSSLDLTPPRPFKPWHRPRNRHCRMPGGVCFALARTTGVNLTLFRLVTFVGFWFLPLLFGPIYLAFWFLLPLESPQNTRIVQPRGATVTLLPSRRASSR